ncbi:hypothetical protein NEOLI_004059 [Neolecta irregularis DAH-3]|uniref:Uncharacterized protein n=1 Tax=Neolecta irregularis (strain DAH-3) TaxID=1198029 RepID=A0A1U7LSG8_NEOID|nr:hypothetical protein NEOLI_004059 [Neolecta irregularis DAH-3]|eukprot:OLL25607.1 hypothetical protein NEOLI_004059 [Neolecta irregularis DAH-3]
MVLACPQPQIHHHQIHYLLLVPISTLLASNIALSSLFLRISRPLVSLHLAVSLLLFSSAIVHGVIRRLWSQIFTIVCGFGYLVVGANLSGYLFVKNGEQLRLVIPFYATYLLILPILMHITPPISSSASHKTLLSNTTSRVLDPWDWEAGSIIRERVNASLAIITRSCTDGTIVTLGTLREDKEEDGYDACM